MTKDKRDVMERKCGMWRKRDSLNYDCSMQQQQREAITSDKQMKNPTAMTKSSGKAMEKDDNVDVESKKRLCCLRNPRQ